MIYLAKRFAKDDSGATAIEYGLIAGLIAVMLIGSLNLVRGSLINLFTRIVTALNGVAP